jgi:hypothetical protein
MSLKENIEQGLPISIMVTLQEDLRGSGRWCHSEPLETSRSSESL